MYVIANLNLKSKFNLTVLSCPLSICPVAPVGTVTGGRQRPSDAINCLTSVNIGYPISLSSVAVIILFFELIKIIFWKTIVLKHINVNFLASPIRFVYMVRRIWQKIRIRVISRMHERRGDSLGHDISCYCAWQMSTWDLVIQLSVSKWQSVKCLTCMR